MTTDRTWLIRTKQNKILGPVSKEKVIELVNSGSLTADDEVCSGNGYWFWIKEKDLVQKYLFDGTPQGFNPVAEAHTSLANVGAAPVAPESFEAPVQRAPEVSSSDEEEPTLFPDEDDLDFPDIEDKPKTESSNSLFDEILDYKPKPANPEPETPKVEASGAGEDEEVVFPDDDDLEFPDLVVPERKVDAEEPPAAPVMEEAKSDELSLDLSASATKTVEEAPSESEDEGPAILPDDDDLAYPDMGLDEAPKEPEESESDDLILDLETPETPDVSQEDMGNDLDINSILKEEKADLPEEPVISEETEKNVDELLGSVEQVQEMPKPKKKKRRRKKKKSAEPKQAPKRNDRMIMYVLVLVILVILYGVYFYYTQILGQSLVLKKIDPFFNEAQAQEKIVDVKKKFH
jgi:hypothetical protein